MKTITIALLIPIILLLGCQTQPSEQETLKIGAVLPLTGNLAFLGDDYQNALQLAVEDINAQGGIEGRQVEIIFEDGKGDAQTSLSAARALKDTKDAKLILTAFRGASLAISSAMENDDVIIIANTATSTNQAIGKANFFPLGAEMTAAGGVIGAYLEENSLCKSLAFVSENTDAGKDKVKGVKGTYTGDIAAEEYVDPSMTDYRTTLTKLKAASPECVFFELRNANTPLFLKQMEELDMRPRLFANSYVATAETIKNSPDNIQGLIISTNAVLPTTNERAAAFIAAYRTRFGEEPSEFSAAIYDGISIYVAAAEGCEQVSRDCVAANIHRIGTWDGVLGTEVISPTGDIQLTAYTLRKVEGSGFVDVE